jgi:hypothetical protein
VFLIAVSMKTQPSGKLMRSRGLLGVEYRDVMFV